jgi:ketosteroid isomerase-like protein
VVVGCTFEVSKKNEHEQTTTEEVEKEFFDALMNADVENLVRILAGDFALIDVMSGSRSQGANLSR